MPGEAYIMDNGEYINLFVMSQIPDQFANEAMGQISFSDFALNVPSGSPYTVVDGSESS